MERNKDSYINEHKVSLSEVTNSGHLERITTQTIKYKDYYGAMEVDVETDSIYGRVLYIPDVVTFKAETVKQAKIEFAKSVEDYLDFLNLESYADFCNHSNNWKERED